MKKEIIGPIVLAILSGSGSGLILLRIGKINDHLFWLVTCAVVFGAAVMWIFKILTSIEEKSIPPTKGNNNKIDVPWQMNHLFLFNTLHNISALTLVDSEKARTTIEQLAELVRIVSDTSSEPLTLLAQEIRCADRLLDIEKARLGDRLVVVKDISSDCLEEYVPGLVLLPIIENTVRHGVEMSEEAVQVTLRARCIEDVLLIEVSDTGKSVQSGKYRTGEILDQRLQKLHAYLQDHYGVNYLLQVTPQLPQGTKIRLQLPRMRR